MTATATGEDQLVKEELDKDELLLEWCRALSGKSSVAIAASLLILFFLSGTASLITGNPVWFFLTVVFLTLRIAYGIATWGESYLVAATDQYLHLIHTNVTFRKRLAARKYRYGDLYRLDVTLPGTVVIEEKEGSEGFKVELVLTSGLTGGKMEKNSSHLMEVLQRKRPSSRPEEPHRWLS